MPTTNRYRAGGPPPLQLHRGAPPGLPANDDQGVRDGYDHAMNAPINKDWSDAVERERQGNPLRGLQNAIPRTEAEPAADATKDQTAADFVFWFWSRALWTVSWFGLGILYARHFS